MLVHARALLSGLIGYRHCALGASLLHLSNFRNDIAEANRELDEFFGVSNSGPVAPNSVRGSFPCDSSTSLPCQQPASTSAARIENEEPPPQLQLQRQLQPQLHLPKSKMQVHSSPHSLTHIDASGTASMVDVSQKAVTVREAQASCVVALGEAFELVAANTVAKGDVLKVAQLAGICGAKATANLIPLCHNIPISKVDVQLQLDSAARVVIVRALVRTDGKTGVEMEALTAASVAALTVYDMCKAAAKDMVIGQLQLDYKSGGRSGTYLRAGLGRSYLLPSARPPP